MKTVFIQAGHKGRTSGATGAVNATVGLTELYDLWVITSRATEVLVAAGVEVIHEDASLVGTYPVDLAVFCHFDGSTNKAVTAASVGYDDPSDADAAADWKEAYGAVWWGGFHPDNFTSGLSGYYGFKHTVTTDAEIVIEFGTISNNVVAEWIQDRLIWLGDFLAWWISKRIGEGNVPYPLPYNSNSEEPVADIVIPKWLKEAWAKAIAAGFIDATDGVPDDPNSAITLGRLVAFLERIDAFEEGAHIPNSPTVPSEAVDAAFAAVGARLTALDVAVNQLRLFDDKVKDLG